MKAETFITVLATAYTHGADVFFMHGFLVSAQLQFMFTGSKDYEHVRKNTQATGVILMLMCMEGSQQTRHRLPLKARTAV